MYKMREKEKIFIYTGPDGSGRKTVGKMVATVFDMVPVISYTTREPRPYERDGEDYHFVDEETFKNIEAKGEFIESVEIDGYHYGIREQDIAEAFKNHNLVYVTLNPEGAEKLKQLYGDKVMRFFIYANRDTVYKRLKKREDDEQEIERLMSHYDEVMKYKNQCEHVFENYDSPHISYQISEVIEEFLERDIIITDY